MSCTLHCTVIRVFFFLVQRRRSKRRKRKEREQGGAGAQPPAKNLVFEHFYDALSPFDPRNRILSARTLRSSIFRAIRTLDPDFQIRKNQEYLEILYPRRCKGKYKIVWNDRREVAGIRAFQNRFFFSFKILAAAQIPMQILTNAGSFFQSTRKKNWGRIFVLILLSKVQEKEHGFR